MNVEFELLTIQLDVDQKIEEQYLWLNDKLAIMRRIQEMKRCSKGRRAKRSSEYLKAILGMMEEATAVTSRDNKVLGKVKEQAINKGVFKLEFGQGFREGNVNDMITSQKKT